MGNDDVIEDYLGELDRGLRPLGRRRRARILAEAHDHLREASADRGDDEALRRFGTPEEIAAAHLEAAGLAAPRRAVAAFAVAGIAYGLIQAAASPATFGLYPGGPWPDDVPPHYLAWKVDLAGAAILVAFLVGLLALASAWTTRHQPLARRFRPAQLAVGGAVVFAASWPFETTFLVQRGNAVDGSPPTAITALVCTALLTCHLGALWITARSLRLARAAAAISHPA